MTCFGSYFFCSICICRNAWDWMDSSREPFACLAPATKTSRYLLYNPIPPESIAKALAFAWEERSRAGIRLLAGLTPFLVVAVYMNNRRLAFVAMATTVLVAYLMMQPSKLKRRITLLGLGALPLLGAYFIIGANSTNPFFAPAHALSTVSNSTDASSATRDIENYNLSITLKHALLMGTGFGHEYEEVVRAWDISSTHPLYLFIPHNSVLWLVSVGGLVAFPLLWAPYFGIAYFAARAHRLAQHPRVRAATLVSLCIGVIVMLQAWGDMGVNSYTPGVLYAVGFAVAARLEALKRVVPSSPPPGLPG